MDNKELVEQITRAVMERLGGAAASSGGAGGAGGTPSNAAAQQSGSGNAGNAEASQSSAESVIIPGDLAKYIDHTLLKPDATKEQVEKLCDEAIENHFYSVCVNTTWTEFCAKRLRGTDVHLAVVVGFPLGAMSARAKGFEARHAVELGADEIDMVINVGALKSRQLDTVEEDVRAVRRSLRQRTVLKVIIETSLLTDEEKVLACQIAKKAGADFVKTSTGFSTGGATAQDVALMRRTVGRKMGVKASGGVRSFDDAVAMIGAGATRLGTSSGVAIVRGAGGSSSY